MRRGQHRDDPVIYLEHDPGEFGEVYLEVAPCPRCGRGQLTREDFLHGSGWTCTGGCGQRFWKDTK